MSGSITALKLATALTHLAGRSANLWPPTPWGCGLRGDDLRRATMDNGFMATDLVCRLAGIGACTSALVWASGLDPRCSWRTAWEAANPEWREWLGDTYEEAVDRLMEVEL